MFKVHKFQACLSPEGVGCVDRISRTWVSGWDTWHHQRSQRDCRKNTALMLAEGLGESHKHRNEHQKMLAKEQEKESRYVHDSAKDWVTGQQKYWDRFESPDCMRPCSATWEMRPWAEMFGEFVCFLGILV